MDGSLFGDPGFSTGFSDVQPDETPLVDDDDCVWPLSPLPDGLDGVPA